MEIETVRHKALRAYIETGAPRGLDARIAGRIRSIVAFLAAAESVDELNVPPNFGFPWLKGDRAGIAAMTLPKNWRLTFKVNDSNAIIDLNLEDYH